MKGGKEDGEKLMGPLFPRLHVNDTADKGGPRAPPRNKMALYEQLSIPSQRYGSSASSAPVPLHNNGALFSPAASSQGCGHDRTLFQSFYAQKAPSYSTDKVNSRSSDGVSGNAASVSLEPKFVKNMSFKASNVGRASSAVEHTSFHRHDASNKRDLGGRKDRDDDDFMVPTLADPGTVTKEKVDLTLPPAYSGHCAATESSNPPKHIANSCSCATEMQKSEDKSGKKSNNLSKKLISSGDPADYANCPAEGKQNGSGLAVHSIEKIASTPLAEVILSERPRYVKCSLSRDRLCGPSNGVGSMCNEPGSCPDSRCERPLGDNGCSNEASTKARSKTDIDMSERGGFLKIRNEHPSSESPANSNESPSENKTSGKVQPGDKDRNDDASETSMLDTVSGLEISPDDIVGVIGPKQFWKARRAMVNQQRLFSVQVFELHRLIKVQKLFAGSPHLLLEDELYLTIPSKKAADSKILSDLNSKPQPPIVKQNEVPPEVSETAKFPTAGKPVSSVGDGITKKELTNQASSNGHCNGPQDPAAADGRNTAWCFPPMGTQWLVPVMSPSEGLIYKPIAGPCPPAGGLMSPVYSTCTPLGLPVIGDLNNSAYVLPPSQQGGIAILPPGAQGYFPPYGVDVVNPMLSGRMPCEQANAPPGNLSHSQAEQSSAAEANMNMHSRGSCNMSSRKGDAFSCHNVKFQARKESEFQGSSASTPSIRFEKMKEAAGQASEGRDSVQLLPQTPAAVDNLDRRGHAESGEHHSRVIKVVPHNPLTASESAARIFRSIQKERQRYDSL
ncbi:protein HEADING DATE 3B-like [Nymphaea colorata]|nr:protein HEADING DATE 3B-like [Nymphaea colorata]